MVARLTAAANVKRPETGSGSGSSFANTRDVMNV